MTPEIERRDQCSLHVYCQRGQQPRRPRVHVRRHDGSATTVLGLPLLEVLIGPPVTEEEMHMLLDCLQRLVNVWDELNG